ncbi:MAG: hypothetical protein ACLUF9_06010 [Oscillospiraceae bacterium]
MDVSRQLIQGKMAEVFSKAASGAGSESDTGFPASEVEASAAGSGA